VTVRVFLAGATGAIGAPLTQLLLQRDYRIVAMTRSASRAEALRGDRVTPVVADALIADDVLRVIADAEPDVIVHQLTDLPGNLDPSQMEAAIKRNANIRTVGTANLVDAAVRAGVRHVVAQSIAWAYRPGAEPHREEDPLDSDAVGTRAISVGGVIALENAVLRTPGIDGCVLRYGQIYGPGTGSDDSSGKTIPLHVEAAAWAALLAVEKRASGLFNVAEENSQVSSEKAHRDLGWRSDSRV
jgi:nucleoside-diphosphate-sugar epimerase